MTLDTKNVKTDEDGVVALESLTNAQLISVLKDAQKQFWHYLVLDGDTFTWETKVPDSEY